MFFSGGCGFFFLLLILLLRKPVVPAFVNLVEENGVWRQPAKVLMNGFPSLSHFLLQLSGFFLALNFPFNSLHFESVTLSSFGIAHEQARTGGMQFEAIC